MNFRTFAVGTTNVFPASNTTEGGQYLSEWNLRSRESVGTDPNVHYMIGPSYTHGPSDFSISKQTDGAGVVISNTAIEISEGSCLLNGHFVQTLAPMVIDLLDANETLKKNSMSPLKGKLVIGFRAMYSTEATMAGSLIPEGSTNYYEGLQVVILPPDQFKLPSDVPTEPDKVTAHLKLAEFNYINGNISSIVQNIPGKYQMIPAMRISNVDQLISKGYVGKNGLNPKKLYVFAGKGTDPKTGKDTWCDATDSMMVWDKTPQLTLDKPIADHAQFVITASGVVQLLVPHKQVDGMTNGSGAPQYYAPVAHSLPVANYSRGTSGTVDSAYTNHIKEIGEKIDNFYQMVKGKQVGYLEVLDEVVNLPKLNPAWSVGDYILVNEDNTQEISGDGVRAPSTMYVVIPGIVSTVKYVTKTTDTEKVPTSIKGICIATEYVDDVPDTADSETMCELFGIPNVSYRGIANTDYFVAMHTNDDGKLDRYYYQVATTQDKEYSNAVHVTGQIPLAQEAVIGGFLNVPDTTLDGGYIFRDENGHLRLLDYQLLRSGTLAYQLAEDFTVPAGLTADEVQNNLDEYVNHRVAFRNESEIVNTDIDPYVIHVYVNLSEETEGEHPVITIRGLDSRFNTSVNLHIKGKATSNTTINILDCEKLRIDSNIEGEPVINIYRCNLYYDASVLDYLNHIEDLSLWYERYSLSDPNLIVDNMTVIETDAPIISDDIDIWSHDVPNDNHYTYALKSITFDKSGTIIGCQLYVRNDTTANIEENKYIIVAEFNLPSGSGLVYPASRLTKQLKVTGSFVTTYPTSEPSGYKLVTTQFSALTQEVDEYTLQPKLKGSISLFTDVMFIDRIEGVEPGTPIDGWESNSFHIFSGGIVG